MKYSLNAGSISRFVKIVNFVGGAKSEWDPLVAVIRIIMFDFHGEKDYNLIYAQWNNRKKVLKKA